MRTYAAPIELDHEHWNLATIWRQAWTNSLLAARNGREAILTEDNQGTTLDCEVDNFRLDQVFRNLFENSLAACPTHSRAVDLFGFDDSRPASHSIGVRDRTGLTNDQAKRVFDAFYKRSQRVRAWEWPSSSESSKRTGANIAVGESASPGAEFVVTLPRRQLPER